MYLRRRHAAAAAVVLAAAAVLVGPAPTASATDRAEAVAAATPDGTMATAAVPALCDHQPGRLVGGTLPDELLHNDPTAALPGFVMLLTETGGDVRVSIAPAPVDLDGDGSLEHVGVVLCTWSSEFYPEGYQSVLVWNAAGDVLAAQPLDAVTGLRTVGSSVVYDWLQCDPEIQVCTPVASGSTAVVWDGTAIQFVDPALVAPVGAQPAAATQWSFAGDWWDAVPQLGTESVRGTGCGGDGSLGEVIPDGWWFGFVRAFDGATMGVDVACIYYGEAARPHLDACAQQMPECPADEVSGIIVNNATRLRPMPLAATNTREIQSGGWCQEQGVAGYEAEYVGTEVGWVAMGWLHIQAGAIDYVRYYCPYG